MSIIEQRRLALESHYRACQPSDWLVVEQAQMHQFGAATLDRDWLHTDPQRARQEGPFGGTIAYGFWTLAMLTYLARQSQGQDYPPGAKYGLNYGLDRVRFVGVVPVGARIRNHTKLLSIEPRGPDRFLIKTENTIEVEHALRPALVAEWLVLIVYDDTLAEGEPVTKGGEP